jgi:hypothetical protein
MPDVRIATPRPPGGELAALARQDIGPFQLVYLGSCTDLITWGGWGSNPRPADYEKYGPVHRAHYLHGYHGAVPPIALIAPFATCAAASSGQVCLSRRCLPVTGSVPVHAVERFVRITLLSWEPPIGIEPMTYALRGGRGVSTAVRAVTTGLLGRPPVPGMSRLIQGRC